MTRATVLVPTHRHAETLPWAVQSALAQTVAELEVLIVGDGVDEATRAAAHALTRQDSRVRFFDLPKGPRHGEASRHQVLQEARGGIVTYLSDDDLFYPDHVETMLQLLEDADFAQPLPVFLAPGGEVGAIPGTPVDPAFRDRMCTVLRNVIPLSGASHTRALYGRLPHGWRAAPEDVWTDLHMWRQIFAVPGLRLALGPRATVLVFRSPLRPEVSGEERGRELASWAPRLRDEPGRARLERRLLRECFLTAAAVEGGLHLSHRASAAAREEMQVALLEAQAECARLAGTGLALKCERDDQVERLRSLQAERDALAAELQSMRATAGQTAGELARTREGLETLLATATFRLRARLLASETLREPLRRAVLLAARVFGRP